MDEGDREYQKKLAAAAALLGTTTLSLITRILLKHDSAVIEAGIEAILEAVKREREECARVAEEYLDDPYLSGHGYATGCAEAIRARGQA